MNNVQRGTYLGNLSIDEVDFYNKNGVKTKNFVTAHYTPEQLNNIESLI